MVNSTFRHSTMYIMLTYFRSRLRFRLKGHRFGMAFLAALLVAGNSAAQPGASNEPKASALHEKYGALSQALAINPYRRPLFLESMESSNKISSSAYAVVDSPFDTFSATLKKPGLWCEILILHINTKYCHADSEGSPTTLKVNIGKKTPQALPDTFALDFSYSLLESSASYLAVQLAAEKGPLSTSDYRLELQAVPVAGNKTFMFLRYSYGFGTTGRLAMQTYLATLGRGKIGFTQIGQEQKPIFVGGMRGAVERNTMRYYLAIEAYLASLRQPVSNNQLNARLNHWFDATEQYAEQLHEADKPSYLSMKKDEHQRQQAVVLR